jgi:polysaccharide export outer membrane protein
MKTRASIASLLLAAGLAAGCSYVQSAKSGLQSFGSGVTSRVSALWHRKEIRQKERTEEMARAWSGQGANYRFLPSDELEVRSPQRTELNASARVDGFGNVVYPYLGEVHAQGLTATELAEKLKRGLVDAELYRNPELIVNLRSTPQQFVYVLGEVEVPGKVSINGSLALMEAVGRAGGPTFDAQLANVLLIRGSTSPPAMVVVNLRPIVYGASGDTTIANFTMIPGDVLYVPETIFADVERYFQKIAVLVGTVVNVERGIIFYPDVQSITTTGEFSNPNQRVIVAQ